MPDGIGEHTIASKSSLGFSDTPKSKKGQQHNAVKIIVESAMICLISLLNLLPPKHRSQHLVYWGVLVGEHYDAALGQQGIDFSLAEYPAG